MKTQSESFEAKKRCGLLLQEAAALLRREFEHAAGPEGLTLTHTGVALMGDLGINLATLPRSRAPLCPAVPRMP